MVIFVKCLALKYAKIIIFLCCKHIQISFWENVITVGNFYLSVQCLAGSLFGIYNSSGCRVFPVRDQALSEEMP